MENTWPPNNSKVAVSRPQFPELCWRWLKIISKAFIWDVLFSGFCSVGTELDQWYDKVCHLIGKWFYVINLSSAAAKCYQRVKMMYQKQTNKQTKQNKTPTHKQTNKPKTNQQTPYAMEMGGRIWLDQRPMDIMWELKTEVLWLALWRESV